MMRQIEQVFGGSLILAKDVSFRSLKEDKWLSVREQIYCGTWSHAVGFTL